MTSRVLEIQDVIEPDRLATKITDDWLTKDMLRNSWKSEVLEILKYVYATDTTQTSNSSLPWNNKTTIPKLCQIADNLLANYMSTMFPQRKSIIWEANELDSASVAKRDAVVNYSQWMMSQPIFKHEIEKCVLDFIHTGNPIATVEWLDQRVATDVKIQAGYVGPAPRRINPFDIVFAPTAENFYSTPKIVRSVISLGELKELLERLSKDENTEEYLELWKYLRDLRTNAHTFEGDWTQRDQMYAVQGFTSFREYLTSDIAEVLTFYGDMYDDENDIFLKNHVITVVDRHKLIGKKPNPSFFGYPPIFHTSWRKRQDNLWGMSPLANLVGMQYKIDHHENMAADIADLCRFPVQKIKGFVEDYTWQPGEKIFVSEEGDVDLVTPDVDVLQSRMDIQNYERLMEEMAGAPREAMGFRTPGEKTKYEVQRLENAAARLFQHKIKQFEEQFLEPLLNAMVELARRNLTGSTVIKVFDDEFKVASFQSLTAEDITGIGRIKPVASRHFAEQAELVQNLTNLTNSGLWPTVQPHFSGVKLAKIVEQVFNLDDYEVVMPNVALAEQADAQKLTNTLQEQVMSHAGTATGIGEDYDIPPDVNQIAQQAQAMEQ